MACAGVGQYEKASAALFRDQAIWGKSGDIEATIVSALTSAELASVKQALKYASDKIDAALERDLSVERSFRFTARRRFGFYCMEPKSSLITTSPKRFCRPIRS